MNRKPSWNLQQLAKHYAETLTSPANAHGQHISPIFGESHMIMREARKRFPENEVDIVFFKTVKESAQ